MKTEHRLGEVDLEYLVQGGRKPIAVRGWREGTFFLIPPEGAKRGEKPCNEQSGEFPSGYGEFIFPESEGQAREIEKRIKKASVRQPA